MSRRRWACIGPLSILFSSIYPAVAQQAGPTLTLTEAWQQAATSNKAIGQQRQQVAVSQELLKDRQLERLPKLPVTGQYAYLGGLYGYEVNGGLKNPESRAVPPSPHAYAASLNVDWEVYTGGRIKNNIASQRVSSKLEVERLALTQSEVRLRVATAYLDLQRNRAYQQLTQGNIAESDKRQQQIQALYKGGVVLRSDLLRADLQLSRQRLLLTEITNNIALSNQRLDLLLGAPEDQVNQPEAAIGLPAVAGTYADYLRQAQGQAPELRIAGLQTKLSELRLVGTAVAKRPQVGMFAGYSYNFPNRLVFPNIPQIYSFGEVGVRIAYNILGGYADRHAEKAAELSVQRQQLATEAALDDKRLEVKTAHVRYQESLERLRIAEQSIGQATENYRIVKSTYFNQLALLTDLLDADNQLLQARFDLVTAQVQVATYSYQLHKALGTI
jgi:outer membrane protein TolC